MKILMINASPRKERSNSSKVAHSFLEGMQKPEDTISEISLYSSNLQECRGCFACWNNSEHACIIRDDMSEWRKMIEESDVILFSFPLYFYFFPSRLKAFIDRLLPVFDPFMEDSDYGGHRARIDLSQKKFVFISTCGFYTAKGNYDLVLQGINKIFNGLNTETIFVPQGELFSVPELKKTTDERLQLVQKAGEVFRNGSISPQLKGQVQSPLYERRVFEAMADASWKVDRDGEKPSRALTLIRQMAALYNPSSYTKDQVFTFDFSDPDELIQIQLKKDRAVVVVNGTETSDLIIHTPFSVWQEISRGELSGDEALIKGLYRIEGDLQYLIDWDQYFSSGGHAKPAEPEKESIIKTDKKKSSFFFLLFPWILYWSLPQIIGPQAYLLIPFLISLELCLTKKYELNTYDVFSFIAVIFFSLASMIGNLSLLLAGSYLLFGILWSLSLFTKIPVTAWYVSSDYGGEKMLKNTIFLQTNRIISVAWGCWYLLFGIVGLLSPQILFQYGWINWVMTIVLSVFTAWFKGFWPSFVAKGGFNKSAGR